MEFNILKNNRLWFIFYVSLMRIYRCEILMFFFGACMFLFGADFKG